MFYRLPEFNYYRPSSLREALELIDELEDYKILAGGTDLLVDMRVGRFSPKNIVDINRVRELDYIELDGSRVRIGALTRLETIASSQLIAERLPLLRKAVLSIGSWQIRCLATIGGNLCNASPAADTAPPLLAYDAELVLASRSGERRVDVSEFFKGPRATALRKNELLKEIAVPIREGYGYSYIKVGRRSSFTLSIVSVATLVKTRDGVFKDVRIALNSVAPTPVRARSVEKCLVNREVSSEAIEEASERVLEDISPISDVRASAEYRKKLSVVLVRDSIGEALSTVEGGRDA